MAKKINILTTNGGNLPVANNGLKLSEIILIEKIEEDERFKSLFTIDENLLQRITDNMKADKFDPSQPVHLWYMKDAEGNEHYILIDGYTRVKAATLAGLKSIPYFKHFFDNYEDAYRYALHLQVNRRNLEGIDLLKNINELMGSDYIKNLEGNKNEAIGKELGVSGKTVERGQKVNSKASKEQLDRIKSGEASVNKVYNEIVEQETVDEKADDEQRSRLEEGKASVKDIFSEIKKNKKSDESQSYDFSEFDNISDVSDISDGPPAEENTHTDLNFTSTEDKEIPVIEADQSYKEGHEDGYQEGASEFGKKLFGYALAEVSKGRTPEEIFRDITDFSGSEIIKFQLSEENEAIIQGWEVEI